MDNAIMILSDEKQRLKNCAALSSQRLQEVYAPALIRRPGKGLDGQDAMMSYIDIDRFTPEQMEQFNTYSKFANEQRAKLSVFENYVKGLVPQETVQSYNQFVEPTDRFKGVSITCNNIELNENGEFSKFSIKVGPINVESPQEMTFEQFSQLYTSSLNNLLTKSLGEGLSQEEILQQLQSVGTEVYLQQKEAAMHM